ncbi:MAG: superoxide dismutase [Patescibacteria group bacterium]|jgi:Fe-Mn family superoxide dismutase
MNKFITPQLPYAYDALEPYLDKETVVLHHDKHHETYTQKLNMAIEKHPGLFETPVEKLLSDLDAIPEDIRLAVRNAGGGHYNHNLYWMALGPKAGGEPTGELLAAIMRDFGSFEKLKELMSEAALNLFGSGWAWLSLNGQKLVVEKTVNQDSPLSIGHTPVLGLDVWEHAYYLKYRNVRADYIKAFWQAVNWVAVEASYMATK